MKKLLTIALVAAFAASVFAAEEKLEAEVKAETRVEQVQTTDSGAWPSVFAFAEWPSTPDLVGLRLSIPFSSRQECVTGVDLGLFGYSQNYEGFALNVCRNSVRDSFGGVQVGIYNTVNRADLFCVQAGLLNEANSFRGVQGGLINIAGDGQGVQVGLINRCETLYGFQLGLVNVIRSAELQVFPGVNIGF